MPIHLYFVQVLTPRSTRGRDEELLNQWISRQNASLTQNIVRPNPPPPPIATVKLKHLSLREFSHVSSNTFIIKVVTKQSNPYQNSIKANL